MLTIRMIMSQEDKELLCRDLCARLPYNTMVQCKTDNKHKFDETLQPMHIMNFHQFDSKPYLRPMSSMTEKEKKYILDNFGVVSIKVFGGGSILPLEAAPMYIDWLNAHHFDYRGLIEKGLAIIALEWMYYSIKNE